MAHQHKLCQIRLFSAIRGKIKSKGQEHKWP